MIGMGCPRTALTRPYPPPPRSTTNEITLWLLETKCTQNNCDGKSSTISKNSQYHEILQIIFAIAFAQK